MRKYLKILKYKIIKFRNDNNKYNSMDLVVSKTIKHLNKIVYKIKPIFLLFTETDVKH